jgi:hypothetical protein
MKIVIARSGPAAGRPAWKKEDRHCEEPLCDEAIQGCSTGGGAVALDCFVASLLAMTVTLSSMRVGRRSVGNSQ